VMCDLDRGFEGDSADKGERHCDINRASDWSFNLHHDEEIKYDETLMESRIWF